MNITDHVFPLLKQWIKGLTGSFCTKSKQSRGALHIQWCVREINKLAWCFFKNKQLSKSHSGAPHAHLLPPTPQKPNLRKEDCFFFIVSCFFYCSIPLYVSILEPNQVRDLMWCLLCRVSLQSNPTLALGCACDLRFERAKKTWQ